MSVDPLWQDILLLEKQLNNEERMLRDAMHSFCQSSLQP